jgi:hypothetical protein
MWNRIQNLSKAPADGAVHFVGTGQRSDRASLHIALQPGGFIEINRAHGSFF